MENQKLVDWARSKNINYNTAYSQYKRKQIEAYKSESGEIILGKEPDAPIEQNIATINSSSNTPLALMTEAVGSDQMRRNASSTIVRTDRFINITNGISPFSYNSTASAPNNSGLNTRDSIIIAQMAYYNFSIFKSTIDLMCDFSLGNIYYTGGSKTSRTFFDAYFKKINLKDFQERFFREIFRSSNVFIYRLDAEVNDEDVKKISQIFGSKSKKIQLPARYVILNPADISLNTGLWYSNTNFYKTLSDYELSQLRNPRTPEDQAIFDNLPEDVKKQIKTRTTMVLLPLDSAKTIAVFFRKQDYENMAIPLFYGVLEDLSAKAELKKMDMAIARTSQQILLILTMGSEETGTNPALLESVRQLVSSQTINRTLIGDWTLKGTFLVPEIDKILTKSKYEILNEDILAGLGNFLLDSSEKFANTSAKMQAFVERLKTVREIFLNNFLIPEIKRIAKLVGFKNYPDPSFDEINLKDESVWGRIYAQLAQLGLLTPEETFEALNSGRLPNEEESLESQEKYKSSRDKGYYQPLTSSPYSQMQLTKEQGKQNLNLQTQQQEHDVKITKINNKHNAENPPAPSPQIHINAPIKLKNPTGRPNGSKSPQTTKKIGPIGTSSGSLEENINNPENNPEEQKYSISKIKDNFILYAKLDYSIKEELKKKHNIPELTPTQIEVSEQIGGIIVANENPEEWNNKIKEYIENPIDKDQERINELNSIMYDHQIGGLLAGILLNSKI